MCPQQACYSVIKSWFWWPLRALVYAVFGGTGNFSLWTGCCERWCWASSRASISHPGEFLWTTGGGSLGESLFPQSELFSVLQHYSLLGLCDQVKNLNLNWIAHKLQVCITMQTDHIATGWLVLQLMQTVDAELFGEAEYWCSFEFIF